jgi:hypothetical protein
MKVNEVVGQQAVQNTTGVRDKKSDKAGADFSSLLDGELLAGTETNAGVTSSVGSIDSLEQSQSLSGSMGTGEVYTDVTSAIDAQLGKLEEIGNSLQDSNVSLKQVDEMMTGLSNEADNLQTSLGDLPSEHPLRQIGDELNVLSYVESVKWRRGDYI